MVSVIYEDYAVLVVHKPGGTAVQTKRLGEKDMISLLKNYRAGKGEEPYIGVVHRLDQPVEGVMVFAKTPQAAADLSRQFSHGQTEKYYHALVYVKTPRDIETGKEYTLTDYLVKDGKNNCSFVVEKSSPGAKKAVLTYRFLNQGKNLARVEVKLQTGRHHQIRVQFSHGGYPLVGDRKYGSKEAVESAEGNLVALCSVRIVFTHPVTLKKMEFTTIPENPIFEKALQRG
ncbi:MAG: RluA family pseudouridine synthase [Roseburia sp.]|nr:RluA family pseudouridine synthase [Roseburia sp.]